MWVVIFAAAVAADAVVVFVIVTCAFAVMSQHYYDGVFEGPFLAGG